MLVVFRKKQKSCGRQCIMRQGLYQRKRKKRKEEMKSSSSAGKSNGMLWVSVYLIFLVNDTQHRTMKKLHFK